MCNKNLNYEFEHNNINNYFENTNNEDNDYKIK